jgi:hypothetical protein
LPECGLYVLDEGRVHLTELGLSLTVIVGIHLVAGVSPVRAIALRQKVYIFLVLDNYRFVLIHHRVIVDDTLVGKGLSGARSGVVG